MTLSWYPWPQKDTWYSNQKFVQNFKIFPFEFFEIISIPIFFFFFFLAHHQGERFVGGERLVPRDPLVRATVRNRNQPDEIRRLRIWRWRSSILPRWRRMSHHTINMEHSAKSKVNIWNRESDPFVLKLGGNFKAGYFFFPEIRFQFPFVGDNSISDTIETTYGFRRLIPILFTHSIVIYEGGSVMSQARSLWRLELARTKWAGGFINWLHPMRIRHLTTGRYLGVKENNELYLVDRYFIIRKVQGSGR